MLFPAMGGEMTTVPLAIIGMVLAGLFSRVMRVPANVCTLGFALFAALLVWQPGSADHSESRETAITVQIPRSAGTLASEPRHSVLLSRAP